MGDSSSFSNSETVLEGQGHDTPAPIGYPSFAPASNPVDEGGGMFPFPSSSKIAINFNSEPEPNPNYLDLTENQDTLLPAIRNGTKKCLPNYVVLNCDCGHQVVVSGCMKKNCEICKKYLGKHRSYIAFRKLTNFTDFNSIYLDSSDKYNLNEKVLYTVFTIPEMLRPKYADGKECRKLRIKAWKILKSFGAVFGFEVTHPISEKQPNKFNPHFNFVWRQKKGFPYFIDVKRLAREWMKLLKTNLFCDCWHDYEDKLMNIKHITNYVCRTFPEFADWAGSLRWFGDCPDLEEVDCLCPVCRYKPVAIGTVSLATYQNWLKESEEKSERPPPRIPIELISLYVDKGKKETPDEYAFNYPEDSK